MKTLDEWQKEKGWPVWLLAGMKAGRPVNAEFSEEEADALAAQVAGLPLGRG
jgi:hypothetical protein